MPATSNTCRRCNQTKEAKHFYPQKRNSTGLENICKECKSIERAARRYSIPEERVEHLYARKTCMCCGKTFKDRMEAHIHHTQKHGVRGLVCRNCNYVLSDETSTDRQRIEACLEFMARNNLLDTVNPQERPNSIEARTESSETTCCETLTCKQCKKTLDARDFHQKAKSRSPRRVCKQCWNANWRLRNTARRLRVQAINCECCKNTFTKKNKSCVHHIGDNVHGIVCNRCNQVLGDESLQRCEQLRACLRFMI